MNNICPEPRMVGFGTAILDNAVRVILCFKGPSKQGLRLAV